MARPGAKASQSRSKGANKRRKTAPNDADLFRKLSDDPAQARRMLEAGANPNSRHPGFYGNDPWAGTLPLEIAIDARVIESALERIRDGSASLRARSR